MSDNETFDAARRILTNIRSVRVFARETSFEQLLEIQEKLNAVIEERREDAEREAAERQEREKKRQELLQLIQAEGFDLSELVTESTDVGTRPKRKGPKAPPKYQFEEQGETKYWSGRGRTPKPIDEALKAGRSLDDFLIKKEPSGSAGNEK